MNKTARLIYGVLFGVLFRMLFGLCWIYFSEVAHAHTSAVGDTTERDPFSVPVFRSDVETETLSKVSDQHSVTAEKPSRALSTVLIPIQYAKTADIRAVIEGHHQFGFLSPQGSVSVDSRTNTLIVRDDAQHIAAIGTMVKTLDVPVKQVQIEARIVTVTEGVADELGVRWGVSALDDGSGIGGSLEQNLAAVGGSVSADATRFLNVDLPASSANASTIAFQLAKLGPETLLDLELSALESESKAKIISSPRLLTTNHQPAFIEQGTEIPYVQSNSDGDTSVAFKKAVLSLKVTPNITPDHHLILDLRVTQDRPGEVVKTGTGEAVAIITQRLGTQVLVNDGETVVLGGIYQQSLTRSVDQVPVLGKLPLIGGLFRRNYQKNGKNELLIFVTPKVVIQ
jgi:type IV pilus assembly protein PilQ